MPYRNFCLITWVRVKKNNRNRKKNSLTPTTPVFLRTFLHPIKALLIHLTQHILYRFWLFLYISFNVVCFAMCRISKTSLNEIVNNQSSLGDLLLASGCLPQAYIVPSLTALPLQQPFVVGPGPFQGCFSNHCRKVYESGRFISRKHYHYQARTGSMAT